MAQRIVDHINVNTPHKDRLLLIALIAILAFTIVNTVMLATDVAIAASIG